MTKRLLAVIGAVIAAGVLVWAAVGAVTDGTTIAACRANSNGAVRIVNDNSTGCSNNESPVSWSVVGPQGPAGPQGIAGPQGPAGPAGGLNSVQVVLGNLNESNPGIGTGGSVSSIATCPSGTTLISGGASTGTNGGAGHAALQSSFPNGAPGQWVASAVATNDNPATVSIVVQAFALCAS